MDFTPADQVARAVLYEGYLLYPYRTSALKNRHRWTFGCLFPPGYSRGGGELAATQTECLVRGGPDAALVVKAQFLHVRTCRGGPGEAAQDAVEREVATGPHQLGELAGPGHRCPFAFPPARAEDGGGVREHEAVEGAVELSARRVGEGLFRVRAVVRNLTPAAEPTADRDEALQHALVSCHTLLGVTGGEFVSLMDPPEELGAEAARCENVGTWPVLAGEPGRRDLLLSSPVVLYDHPLVAAESPGDLFDATEIDELLTLRIMTLTEEEKRQMGATDARARALLERTEGLTAAQLRRLHGALREAPSAATRGEDGGGLTPGTRVRLRPQGRADVFDLALAGRTAVVAAVERDLEGRVYVAVAVEDDPGQDYGLEGRPGHRFFFRPDEVELLGGEG